MTGLRLNLGAGGTAPDGWTSVDREVAVAGQVLLDLRGPWPWEQKTVEAIVLHHVLDLFDADEMYTLLTKCRRVMQLGGVCRVSCADLHLALERAVVCDEAWFVQRRESWDATVGFYVTQGLARRQVLTPTKVLDAFNEAGFAVVQRSRYRFSMGAPWLVELDSRPKESFFCEAIR